MTGTRKAKKAHTILMIQKNADPTSRVWSDYEGIEETVDGLMGLLQDHFKNDGTQLKYQISDIVRYVDWLAEAVCLTLDDQTNTYVPRDKAWMKEQVLLYLS